MAKREYTGQPIDLTDLPGESHLGNKNGETVDGTTDDDLHGEKTTAWPSVLDKDDFSEPQQKAIEMLCLNPEMSYSAVADGVGCSDTLIYKARKKIQEKGLADDVPFEVKRSQNHNTDTKEETADNDDLTAKEWFIDVMADNPAASKAEIAELVPESKGWHPQNYHNVLREGRGREELKRELVKRGNWADAEGTIREKLEGVEVDVKPPESGENESGPENKESASDNHKTNTDRVSELESAVAELTKELATQSETSGIVPAVVDVLDDETIAGAVTEVLANE